MSNKIKYKSAIGLSYSGKDDETPTISINEANLSADEVVKLAERYGITVVEKPELVAALKKLEVDEEIPEDMYEAIALLLNEIDKRTQKS